MTSPASTDTPVLRDDSIVELHPLRIGDGEDGEHEVGRADTGTFIALPTEGVALLELFAAGVPLGEARRRFAARFGEPPDIAAFVHDLAACGFVRAVDGRHYPPGDGGASGDGAGPAGGLQLFADLPQRRVAWLVSRPMRAGSGLVWLAAAALLLAVPRLRPAPADALLLPGALTNALILAALGWSLVLLHEIAHALTVRALGCVGRLSLSRRLWFLVAQTEMTGVRALPRARRYAPYLAGMTWDLFVVVVCLCLQLAGLGGPVVRTVVYLLALSMVFQLSVFMRTDMYFVIANWLRLGNLMSDTRRLLRNLVHRLVRLPARYDLADVPSRELRIIRWYAPVYVLGTAVAVGVLAVLTVPVTAAMLGIAAAGLARGPGVVAFWDGLGFAVLVGAHLLALAWVVVTERRA